MEEKEEEEIFIALYNSFTNDQISYLDNQMKVKMRRERTVPATIKFLYQYLNAWIKMKALIYK